MDNIEKIKLNGIDYGLGGRGEAKLVARGTYNTTSKHFDLDKELKDNNKLFFIRFYSNAGDYDFTTIAYLNYTAPCSLILCRDSDDSLDVVCSCQLFSQMIDIYRLDDNENGLIFAEEDYCEVYELPFTLGGTE